jgi:hypothetical protein
VNGNFGVSPFREQLAGKPLPAVNYAFVVPRAKHKGAQKTNRRGGGLVNVKVPYEGSGASFDDY